MRTPKKVVQDMARNAGAEAVKGAEEQIKNDILGFVPKLLGALGVFILGFEAFYEPRKNYRPYYEKEEDENVYLVIKL